MQLFFGGEIHTVDPRKPTASAVAVIDGRIAVVGTEAECRAALPRRYEAIDLRGSVLLPGFIDTHFHPVPLIFFDMNADLSHVRSLEEMGAALRAAAAKTPARNWVVGLRFDEQDLPSGKMPTRAEIDALCPERPVVVFKHDGHTVLASSLAVQAAGISAKTPNPPGGIIDREPDGSPAGVFRESAAQLMLSSMPAPRIRTLIHQAADSFEKLLSQGITSAGAVLQTGNEGPSGSAGLYEVFLAARLAPRIPINLYSILIADSARVIENARKGPLTEEDEIGGHRVGAIKIYADGTFGSCTAHMHEPYADEPDKRGFLTIDEDELYRRMEVAHRAGFQVCIHAIGDATTRKCLDLFEVLLEKHPRPDHRHRLEHASQLEEGTIRDLARLGIAVSTQPMFIHSEKAWLEKRLGPVRTKLTYPFRSLIEAGVRVGGASDAPIESTSVLEAMQVCVTREGFETSQCITAEQALRMYTIDAAFIQHEDHVKGSITPGKRADFVVLSENPVRVSPDRISDIQVEQTIIGGETVFDVHGREHRSLPPPPL
jgi:predicted amidohydrolase YtcJ